MSSPRKLPTSSRPRVRFSSAVRDRMWPIGHLALIVDAVCVIAALVKTGDAGKYGVGYFKPDDCDNNKTLCMFTPYPEYEYLKEAYTTTSESILKHDSFTPTRDTILSCPKNISSELPPMPKGEYGSSLGHSPVCPFPRHDRRYTAL